MFQLSGFYCMLSDLRAAMLDSSDAVESQVFATGKGQANRKIACWSGLLRELSVDFGSLCHRNLNLWAPLN